MQWIIGLVTMLVSSTAVRAVVVRIAVALGISMVTYTGIQAGVTALFASAASNFSLINSDTIAVLSMCKLPQALNVIASAYASALTLRGLTSAGVLSRMTFSGSGSALTPPSS